MQAEFVDRPAASVDAADSLIQSVMVERGYREAKRLGIKGRSKMNKGQLTAAVDRRR